MAPRPGRGASHRPAGSLGPAGRVAQHDEPLLVVHDVGQAEPAGVKRARDRDVGHDQLGLVEDQPDGAASRSP